MTVLFVNQFNYINQFFPGRFMIRTFASLFSKKSTVLLKNLFEQLSYGIFLGNEAKTTTNMAITIVFYSKMRKII